MEVDLYIQLKDLEATINEIKDTQQTLLWMNKRIGERLSINWDKEVHDSQSSQAATTEKQK